MTDPCQHCKRAPRAPGKSQCRPCLRYGAKQARKRRADRRARGRCFHCEEAPVAGQCLCPKHKAYSASQKYKRKLLRALGRPT